MVIISWSTIIKNAQNETERKNCKNKTSYGSV